MSQGNLWSLSPEELSDEDQELVLMGWKTGDQIVRDSLDSFSRELTIIYERHAARSRSDEAADAA